LKESAWRIRRIGTSCDQLGVPCFRFSICFTRSRIPWRNDTTAEHQPAETPTSIRTAPRRHRHQYGITLQNEPQEEHRLVRPGLNELIIGSRRADRNRGSCTFSTTILDEFNIRSTKGRVRGSLNMTGLMNWRVRLPSPAAFFWFRRNALGGDRHLGGDQETSRVHGLRPRCQEAGRPALTERRFSIGIRDVS